MNKQNAALKLAEMVINRFSYKSSFTGEDVQMVALAWQGVAGKERGAWYEASVILYLAQVGQLIGSPEDQKAFDELVLQVAKFTVKFNLDVGAQYYEAERIIERSRTAGK